MDSPFRSWYVKPAQQRRPYGYHRPSPIGVPVYPVDPTRQAVQSAYADRQPPVENNSSRRVVQIPVQFFGSDCDRRSESALRIQKVIRGFFVRKSVRKIKEIKAQVDEIEARLSRDEVVDMIRGNERERLRMSEGLMNLLLKLDGIRGIDSGIRVCRKGVTKKAIALQEQIDAICASGFEGNADCKVGIGSQELEDGVAHLEGSRLEENSENSMDDSGPEVRGLSIEKMEVEMDSVLTDELDVVVGSEVNPGEETNPETGTGTWKNSDFDEDGVKEMLVQYNGKDMINGANGDVEPQVNSEIGEIFGDTRGEHEGGKDVEVEKGITEMESPVTSVVQGTPENLDFDDCDAEAVKEMLAFSDDHGDKSCDLSEELKGGDSLEIEDKTSVERSREDMAVTEEEDLNKRKCDPLEQMMEENKKMMHILTQLYERNEKQLQMLDALTNRVELLEKAYLCDKLNNRRKKMKKRMNKCDVTCVED